tara:strand:+ start:4443 stop:5834 length:1392 start_codon:yes stop_codon:yes gene_type:complete
MSSGNATIFSTSANQTGTGVSLDNTRRKFDFGDRVAELAPQQSPFFVYLNKVGKKPTNDPVFKFLEQRHQWQRRNFFVSTGEDWDPGTVSAGNAVAAGTDLHISCNVTKDGKISSVEEECHWILPNQVLAIYSDGDSKVYRFRIDPDATVTTNAGADAGDGKFINHDATNGHTEITGESLIAIDAVAAGADMNAGQKGSVIGSAFAEGTDAPLGWEDIMSDSEGYCQIFKTGMNIYSNTALATEYRGIKNEFQRIWTDKLMEHKMDMEQAFLFGLGNATAGATTTRYTHGIVPYTEANGKVYSMTYASSGYDAFLDAMEDFFAPEGGNSGNKLVLASRKVITYLNKLGNGSFLNNSVGASQYSLDVQNVKGAFGHQVTMVNTIFGNLHFVAEPLFRGPWENYCVAVDLKNVAYRPLVGNGISRDTFVETNVQDNGVDGRQDQVITEAGLEISLPETHAVLKFS